MWELIQKYGILVDFLITERLYWEAPVVARGRPFQYDEDLKILWNDWPYGIDARIVHLVVWTKFEFEDNPDTGDLSDASRAEINAYVERTFLSKIPRENVALTEISTMGFAC